MSLIKEALDKALEADREEEPTATDQYEQLDSTTRPETPDNGDPRDGTEKLDPSSDQETSDSSVMFLIMGVLGFVLVAQILVLWIYVL
jgi:hypothetical protein